MIYLHQEHKQHIQITAKEWYKMELSNEDLKAISDLLQPIRDDLQDVKQKVSGLEKI